MVLAKWPKMKQSTQIVVSKVIGTLIQGRNQLEFSGWGHNDYNLRLYVTP